MTYLALLGLALVFFGSAGSSCARELRTAEPATVAIPVHRLGLHLLQTTDLSCAASSVESCCALDDQERTKIRNALLQNCNFIAGAPSDSTDGSCCSKLSEGGLPPWSDLKACLCAGDAALPGLSAFVNAGAVLQQCQPGSQSLASTQAMARSAVLSINGGNYMPMGVPPAPSAPPIDPPPFIVPAPTPVAPALTEASAGGASARASTEHSTTVMTRSVGSPPAETVPPTVLATSEVDASAFPAAARSASGSGAPGISGTSATLAPAPTPDTSASSIIGRGTLEAVSTTTGSGSMGGEAAASATESLDAPGRAAALGPSTGPTVLHDGGGAKAASVGEQGIGGAPSTPGLT